MRIKNLVEITRGDLLNSPNIMSFEGFSCKAHKVNRGDLFIAIDSSLEDIQHALDCGAYGVMSDKIELLLDDEIAWIKVENINMSLFRLMRYESEQKKLNFIHVSLLQEGILESMSLSKEVLLLQKSPHEAFLSIMKASHNAYIFCSNLQMLKKISSKFDKIKTKKNVTIQRNGSLFLSSFIHENSYYQKVPISPLFILDLSGILTYLKFHGIDFSLEHFKPLEHFEPIFVDICITPQSFGTTRRALIIEKNEKLFDYEAQYLLKSLERNNLLICKPLKSKAKMEANFLYKSYTNLKELSSYSFRYALVLGDKECMLKALQSNANERYPSLF